jgi:hypothetical protein
VPCVLFNKLTKKGLVRGGTGWYGIHTGRYGAVARVVI